MGPIQLEINFNFAGNKLLEKLKKQKYDERRGRHTILNTPSNGDTIMLVKRAT